MSTVLGFLFNRYVFLAVAVLIVVALVGAQKLIWNKWTIGTLVALALGIGVWTAIDKWEASIRADERTIVVKIYEDALTKQKKQAAALLATETAKAAAATKALQDFKITQEKEDAINEKTVSILADKLRALAGPAGRLRDPYQTGCGVGGGNAQSQSVGGTQSGQGNGAEAGWLLSPELTQFLLTKDNEADAINLAYISCRADAGKVRAELK